jgi:hypothetical protein
MRVLSATSSGPSRPRSCAGPRRRQGPSSTRALHLDPGCGRRTQPLREASQTPPTSRAGPPAPLDRTRPHGCKDSTRQYAVDDPLMSCKQQVPVRGRGQLLTERLVTASERCSLLVEPDGPATLQLRWPRTGRRPIERQFIGRSSHSRPQARCRRDRARRACTSTPGPCQPAPVGPPRPARDARPDSGGTERRPAHART